MATFDNTRPAYGNTSAVSFITSFISGTFASVVAWNDQRLTRQALSNLTDRELEDIGLIRGDIDSVAKSAMIR